MDCTKCCELLVILWYFLNMSASDFNIINSASDSDIKWVYIVMFTVNKLHYIITDFLRVKA